MKPPAARPALRRPAAIRCGLRCRSAGLALLFALALAATPAAAQTTPPADDYADLFDPRSLGFETLRDADGRFALQFAFDEQAGLVLAAFALVHPRENREVQVTESRTFAYDPARRTLAITFAGNDGAVREVAGTFATADRAFHVVRTFTATITFDGGRRQDVALRGSQIRPKGKKGCAVEAFPGANMAQLTLKAPWKADSGEWVRDVATRENWTVLRRRIDYRKGEDEFDVIALPGREIAAIGAAAAIERLTCFSFGVDDTEGADAVRLLDLKAGTLFTGAGGEEPRPLLEIGALFQKPRLEGLAAGVEIEAAGAGEPYALILAAPGRFFGFGQGGDLAHRVTLALRIGRSPGRGGEIAESLRFVVKAVAREKTGGGFEPLSLRNGADPGTFEAIQMWQASYAAELAAALGGTVN